MHTEAEAAKRWCPFVRQFQVQVGDDAIAATAINRRYGGSPEKFATCIGSNCMAWRWAKQPKGYCGIAGKS